VGALACKPSPASTVELFGFNWAPGEWSAHHGEVEKVILTELQAAKLLDVHPTPCNRSRR
jgi:hypothetical protein